MGDDTGGWSGTVQSGTVQQHYGIDDISEGRVPALVIGSAGPADGAAVPASKTGSV